MDRISEQAYLDAMKTVQAYFNQINNDIKKIGKSVSSKAKYREYKGSDRIWDITQFDNIRLTTNLCAYFVGDNQVATISNLINININHFCSMKGVGKRQRTQLREFLRYLKGLESDYDAS